MKSRRPLGHRTFGGIAAALFLCANLGIVVLVAHVLNEARTDALSSAQLMNRNLREVAARNVGYLVQQIDLSLSAVVEGLQLTRDRDLPRELQRAILFDKSASTSLFGSILVLDSRGDVRWDMRTDDPVPINRGGRPYFVAQQRPGGAGLYISAPFKAAVDGKYLIALSRRIEDKHGSFDGVVVGTIRLDVLNQFLGRLDLDGGSANLLRNDGILLTREPFREAELGVDLSGTELMRRFRTHTEGEFEAIAQLDNTSRLYSYAKVGSFPLLVSIGAGKLENLAVWRQRSIAIVGLTSGLMLLQALLAIGFWRELRLRTIAELSYRRLASEMESLANTDKLTGLGNRRGFDQTMDREWRRQLRDQRPMAVLIADVDHFKRYNDRHGHAAGDAALVSVGRAIASCIRRPGDYASRIGGEEFAIVLPNTDAAGGHSVAENLRRTIEHMIVPLPSGEESSLTVSIGICSMVPVDQAQFAECFKLADDALYRAKAEGRNRAVLAPRTERLRTDEGPGPDIRVA